MKEAPMGPLILDGKAAAKKINEQLKIRSVKIIEKTGIVPKLATIIVGDNYASQTYVRMKGNACVRAGIESLKVELPGTASTRDVINEIEKLNNDKSVFGILLQHPVPEQVDEPACFNAISIEKDADGVNNLSFARMAMQLEAFGCATPQGIMTLLEEYNIPVQGKEVVIVGRSPILGKPLAMMMLNKNATVTICHSKTENIKEIARRADILCVGIGRPKYVTADWVKDGAVLVDAGYNEGNAGDTDVENIKDRTSAYTPVPGGVGPMTIIMLIKQTVTAAERALGI